MTVATRPVYVIAHRCNGLDDVEAALAAGACAIECDVRYGRVTLFADYDWYVDHDGVYAWSTTLTDWLAKTRAAADKHGGGFALVIFDIKTPERLHELRERVRAKLPSDLSVVFSIADFDNRTAFEPIAEGLRFNEGLAIDQDGDPERVQEYLAHTLRVTNCWYGNGIFVAGVDPDVRPSLVDACALRNANKGIRKAYVWTLAKASSVADYLDNVGVDGVMINSSTIKTVVDHLAGSSTLRRARRADRAFFRFSAGETGFHQPAAPVTGTFKGFPADFLPVDAGVYWSNNKGYFFKGNRYLRYTAGFGVDPGYPKVVAEVFDGWPADFGPVDAAIFWPPKNKVYVFSGARYLRYTPGAGVDAGYPKPIAGNWKNWPEGFGPVSAAIYANNDKAYFFSGKHYIRCNRDPVGVGIEKGPTPIVGNWANFTEAEAAFDTFFDWPSGEYHVFHGTSFRRYRPA